MRIFFECGLAGFHSHSLRNVVQFQESKKQIQKKYYVNFLLNRALVLYLFLKSLLKESFKLILTVILILLSYSVLLASLLAHM